MKSARERMDIIAAYREVGSYPGAAVVCGATAKTVKRVSARHEAVRTSPAAARSARRMALVMGDLLCAAGLPTIAERPTASFH